MTDALERGKRFARTLAALREAGATAEHIAAYRIRETRNDPALFALVYLSHHLADEHGFVSLSEAHEEWAALAGEWLEDGTQRDAIIAPRSMGKSTWFFLILPMWAAAHGHRRFVAAFANSASQAEGHLLTFKGELDRNATLRADYPTLCRPRMRRGRPVADSIDLYVAESGFAFTARGADAGTLGMKVDDTRPDLIVCDDMEPGESNYSAYLAEKRLTTLLDDILPLNVYAAVVIVGTTVMAGSIVDQLRVVAAGGTLNEEITPRGDWVRDEGFRPRHYRAIIDEDDGTRRSIWPEKWSLSFLESIEHTRQYAKNYASSPLGADGDYWQLDDFTALTPELAAAITHEVIEVDPAVTTNKSSDFTAIAAVGWSRERKTCAVFEASQFKLGPDEIRLKVLGFVKRASERGHAVIVRVEANQGGELWLRIFHHMPVRVVIHPAGAASKEVRAADALDHYQRGRVEHAPGLTAAEAQMAAFPKAPHDDLVDAIGAGVRYFLSRKRKTKAGAESVQYA